jgi:hypothetical protein
MPAFPQGLVFPATAAVTMPRLEPHEFYALARELAMGIKELHDILAAHSLTHAQYERIRESTIFNRLLETEIAQWSSARNTPERVRIEAAATFEQILPKLYTRAINPLESLDHVGKVASLIAKVAGIDQSDKAPDATEKFIINIDVGKGDVRTVTLNAQPLDAAPPTLPPSGDTVLQLMDK